MMEGCEKFDAEEAGNFNMMLGKDNEGIITDARKMIRECLSCTKINEGCKPATRERIFTFLESNDEKNG